MKHLFDIILEIIKEDCNEYFLWDQDSYSQTNFEIWHKGELICYVNFSLTVEVYSMPNRYENGMCDIYLDEIEITSMVNANSVERTNVKAKLNELLNSKIGTEL